MKLSKREAENLLDALGEWDEQICPKELADDDVGLNAERYDSLMKRLTEHAYKNDKRAKALPAHADRFIWVLDSCSGDVLRVEIPSHFPENGDYEDYLEANLPNDIRLSDCNWQVGGAEFHKIERWRYHLGF
jgi:hypothetical protein